MKRAVFVLVPLFAVGLLTACGGIADESSSGSTFALEEDPGCTNEDCPPDPGCTNDDCPPDPGCTNDDCPPDPGCTDEDCPPDYPDYYAGCCCFEDYELDVAGPQRLCCCKDQNNVTCRLSHVIDIYHHITIQDVWLTMGQSTAGQCTKRWQPPETVMPWWTKGEGCGWMNQIHKCGPVASSP